MTWTSERVRSTFLEFYAGRAHRRLSSLALIPPGDPTLLFTNAGMVQFKDVFTGKSQVDYDAATTSQKCLRVSGKHNDLENVGRTARHHTFFEMLGNFAFGAYFKRGAIESAWELISKIYQLPLDRMYVTVHPEDHEARAIWTEISGLPPERILNDPENFWSMGDTGPCGPCSEIHIDQGKALSGGVEVPFGQGGDRYLEIWNLVFMQYDRSASGELTPLPRPCIDTGMGLERITAILQGKTSNYDSDLFQPLIQRAAKLAKIEYQESPSEQDVALRVIADHSRSAAFLIADGVYPENEGRGYVIRRVMRRAMRFGKKLGLEGPFLFEVCAEVVRTMGAAYPELVEKADVIQRVVRQEEERFGRTLATGLRRLEAAFEECASTKVLPGEIAFELYDTHGFPLDLTEQACEERGYQVDVDGFHSSMAAQKAKGRASWKGKLDSASDWAALREQVGTTTFVGYETESATSKVVAVLEDGKAVVTALSPFYAESGGQVGDIGTITKSGGAIFEVTDTQRPIEGLVVHRGEHLAGTLAVGDEVLLEVQGAERALTRKNHSATHLLHHALRSTLGDHVKQRGSLVGPHRLRFDFSHFGPLTAAEIQTIERQVNSRIVKNVATDTAVLGKEEAVARGAIAFFGDKYGETVRVLTIGGDSVELCGGTHVRATGDIGLFKIVSDSALAAGVRRVEGVTGLDALEYVAGLQRTLHDLGSALDASASELVPRAHRLTAEVAELHRKIRAFEARDRAKGIADAAPEQLGTIPALIVALDGVGGSDLRDMADKGRQRLGSGVVLLTSKVDDKAAILVAVTADLVGRVQAGTLVKELAPLIGGKGGGRPDLAQAGGNDPAALSSVAERFRTLLRSA
ncbi:MAG: alanine--tRNA ligase [Myxococcales bacterium]|nr:alanine--tRNA ligase [Myxococcales bacterium]